MTRALVFTTALLWISGCCCKPDVATQIKTFRRDNARLEAEIAAADQVKEAQEQYERMLSGEASSQEIFAMFYAENELRRFATEILPMKIPAQDFDKKLRGEIIIERVALVEFLPGNRVRTTAHIRGVNLDYTGKIPDAAKEHVKRFKAGVKEGAVVTLDSVLVLEPGVKRISAHTRCVDAKLKKNSTSLYENQLRDGMNGRALRKPMRVDVSISGRTSAMPTHLLVTGNHLIVFYRP